MTTDASDQILDHLWERGTELRPLIAADLRATVAYIDGEKVGVIEFVGVPFSQPGNIIIAPVVVDVEVLFTLGLIDALTADEAFRKLDEQIAESNNTEESSK